MPRMKQSRKMYGCKLCKTLYTELHKVSISNSRPSNMSIELHIERDHPDSQLDSVIDHITKFSKVSEARAVLSFNGYDALLGSRDSPEGPSLSSGISDGGSINTATPPRLNPTPSKQAQGSTPKTPFSISSAPRKSLIAVLKVSSPVLPTPPASISKPYEQFSSNSNSSPLAGAEKPFLTLPGKPKPKQAPKTRKAQDWLKSLDRTGAPCRKWVRKPFQVRSFTQYAFHLPAWQKKDVARVPLTGGSEELAVEQIQEIPKSGDGIAEQTSSEIELKQSTVQQETVLAEDLDREEFVEVSGGGAKVMLETFVNANAEEAGRSLSLLKREIPSEVENRPHKKTKTAH